MEFFNTNDGATYVCGVYIRVSTEFQDTSISNQQDYFNDYITRMGFTFYDFYTDEALTGTDSLKRKSWKSLIQDGIDGKYNTLLAKSFSRFGRNQLQTLQAITDLMKANVRIVFIEDGLDSLKNYSQFGLFSWLAQQESQRTSSRIKMTWDLYDKQAKIHACHESYGYDYDKDSKNFIINLEEAEVVKRIFSMYVNLGYGCTKIANILHDEKIKTKKGGEWGNNTIRGIIHNCIYVGTLVQGKSKSIDVTIKKRNKVDKDKWTMHENRIEPIIDYETFYKAQLQIQERSKNKRVRSSTSSLFSNLIKCGSCGSSFTIKRQKHFKNYTPYYTCIKYDLKGTKVSGHSRIAIYENDLSNIVRSFFVEVSAKNYEGLESLNKLQKNKDNSIDYNKNLKKIDKKIKETNNQSMQLLTLLTNEVININQYKIQNEQLATQIDKLTKEKDHILLNIENEKYEKNNKKDVKIAIENLLNTSIEKWDNALLKTCIEYLTIDAEKNIEIKII